jgi:acyl carrier protein
VPDLGPISTFILARFTPRGTATLGGDTSLVESGWLDSFAIIDLVAFIEREYRVRLRDEDVVPASFETLTAIGRILARATPR